MVPSASDVYEPIKWRCRSRFWCFICCFLSLWEGGLSVCQFLNNLNNLWVRGYIFPSLLLDTNLCFNFIKGNHYEHPLISLMDTKYTFKPVKIPLSQITTLNRKFTNTWLGISDVCFGYWTDWGSDQPSLPYKSHKTINLTSANSTLIGRPEQYVSINTTSPVETMVKTQVNGQPANVS